MRKRLTSNQGVQGGLFTATLLFDFRPEERRSIDDVWANPFGFTVTEYAIRSDRLEN
jgi:type IV secretion system protein VirB8